MGDVLQRVTSIMCAEDCGLSVGGIPTFSGLIVEPAAEGEDGVVAVAPVAEETATTTIFSTLQLSVAFPLPFESILLDIC